MSFPVLAVLALTIGLDVVGQILFKLGLAEDEAAPETALWLKVAVNPRIWLGLAAYAVEFAAWLFVLSQIALNVAFPIASLSYCGIALASRFILHEGISNRRWIGTALIALGAAIVGATQ